MRRRIMQATLAAVTVAVLLLGVPMLVVGLYTIADTQQRDVDVRAEALGRSVDRRVAQGEAIVEDVLEPYIGGGARDLAADITVITPDGDVTSVGPELSSPVVARTLVTVGGSTVIMEVSEWDRRLASSFVIGLVVVLSAVAFVVTYGMARLLSNRLAAPLIYLAASAEQLGSGQTRPRLEPSGIEEIDLVAAELGRSADRMASRLAVERQFASDASHQLRTPLTALMMRLEEIHVLADSDDVREEARIALEQVERLVTVVDDLLTRSRRASGGTTEPLRLIDVVRQQEEEWRPSFEAADRELVVQVPADLYVLASPGALAQVLATLVENSLRHGEGRTTVEARPSTQSGTSPSGGAGTGSLTVVIEVSDEGAGIADEHASDIFDRDVSVGKGGTGLGLALARDLVAADGGRLELARRRPPIFAVFLSGVPTRLDPSKVLPPGGIVPVRVPRRRRRHP